MGNGLDKNKVILGLSGGVDSTAAALLLKEKGFQVTGLYFDISTGNEQGRHAAEQVAAQVGIPFIYKNVHNMFHDIVVKNFCGEYMCGRTPNPCVLCNPTVKFKTLVQEADARGAYYIATGHYASICYDNQSDRWYIGKAANEKKDQSYMLHRLGQDIISRLIFPMEHISNKEETRNLVRESDLFNAEQKDSQEICFISNDENYIDYIEERGYQCSAGDFVDKDGNVLGRHSGLSHYTIGQRKGLGITFGKPVFVIKLDSERNTVTLGDHEELFQHEVYSTQNFFTMTNSEEMPSQLKDKRVYAKIRYAAKPAEATLTQLENGDVCAVFKDKQRAPAPGQSIVFYLDNLVVGGGRIK